MNKLSKEIFGDFVININKENSIENLIEEIKNKINKENNFNSPFLNFFYKNFLKEIQSRSKFSLGQAADINKKAYEFKNLNLDFSDCYDLEMSFTKDVFKEKEFIEGIRAYFIEKDYDPKWKY